MNLNKKTYTEVAIKKKLQLDPCTTLHTTEAQGLQVKPRRDQGNPTKLCSSKSVESRPPHERLGFLKEPGQQHFFRDPDLTLNLWRL